jgi:uncharacterized protein (TIGR00369 family)
VDKSHLLKITRDNELFRFLGVEIESATPEKVILSMTVTPKVHQYTGVMNGGVSVLLCESAASIGAVMAADLVKTAPVGIEINANHIRAVSKGRITVTAQPIHTGLTITVWDIRIADERDRTVCSARCTLIIRKRGMHASER